ncbi:MAG: hypothetical protein JWQ57_2861 [Mucilaginibacter sp.]|nr:hypothetical protein [Mucilaginibacter sp.]
MRVRIFRFPFLHVQVSPRLNYGLGKLSLLETASLVARVQVINLISCLYNLA